MKTPTLFLAHIPVFLLFFSGCSTSPLPNNPHDTSLPDLTNLYAQVCETSSGPCTPMQCELTNTTYICAESIADRSKYCSTPKYFDDIFSQYSICGDNKETVEKQKVFSYGSTLASVTLADSPDELQEKIQHGTEQIENGEDSPFMDVMLGTIAGSVIGGLVSHMLFGQNNAIPPARPSMVNERPINKSDLEKIQTDTKKNNETLQKANTQTKSESKKRTYNKKSTSKKSIQKKSPSRKRSLFRRRR